MAESPRTAQYVSYIEQDMDHILYYLKVLTEKGIDDETRRFQEKMLAAIYQMTAMIEELHTNRSSHNGHSSNGHPAPSTRPREALAG